MKSIFNVLAIFCESNFIFAMIWLSLLWGSFATFVFINKKLTKKFSVHKLGWIFLALNTETARIRRLHCLRFAASLNLNVHRDCTCMHPHKSALLSSLSRSGSVLISIYLCIRMHICILKVHRGAQRASRIGRVCVCRDASGWTERRAESSV